GPIHHPPPTRKGDEMPHSRRIFCLVLLAGILARSTVFAQGTCCSASPGASGQDCNVIWQLSDSVAACPAGDTLIFTHPSQHPHPSRLRIWVHYEANFCNTRVGVPPESLSITWLNTTGNVRLNDKSTTVFADDSTNSSGETRFTIPSLSGCGNLRVWLKV